MLKEFIVCLIMNRSLKKFEKIKGKIECLPVDYVDGSNILRKYTPDFDMQKGGKYFACKVGEELVGCVYLRYIPLLNCWEQHVGFKRGYARNCMYKLFYKTDLCKGMKLLSISDVDNTAAHKGLEWGGFKFVGDFNGVSIVDGEEVSIKQRYYTKQL